MRFSEGERVYLIGSGERVMCQGHVAYDPGPPSFVTVQYFIAGAWRKENRARSSLRSVKARRDEPIEETPEDRDDGSSSGTDPTQSTEREGRHTIEGSRDDDSLPSDSESLASDDGGREDVHAVSRARDGARRRVRGGRDRSNGPDDRRPGARATATDEAERFEASETPETVAARFSAIRERTTTAKEEASEAIARAAEQCWTAALKAAERNAPYNSAHEAYGVLIEEVAEFFDEVRKKTHLRSRLRLKNEAIDIAAVAIRIAAMYEDPR